MRPPCILFEGRAGVTDCYRSPVQYNYVKPRGTRGGGKEGTTGRGRKGRSGGTRGQVRLRLGKGRKAGRGSNPIVIGFQTKMSKNINIMYRKKNLIKKPKNIFKASINVLSGDLF